MHKNKKSKTTEEKNKILELIGECKEIAESVNKRAERPVEVTP